MVKLLKIYRQLKQLNHGFFLSLGLPPNSCRFTPSCSHYCGEAIVKYGYFKGSIICFWRILRCNPLFKGGADPLP